MHSTSATATATATPLAALLRALPAGLWVVEREASEVAFSVRHLGVASVRGRFAGFEGWVEIGHAGGGRAGGRVEVASLDTGVAARDERLRAEDCFDAGRHPWMTYDGELVSVFPDVEVAGELTIVDRERPLRLTGALADVGRDRVRLELKGVVRRRAYGLQWGVLLDRGLPVVADAVSIRLAVTLSRRP